MSSDPAAGIRVRVGPPLGASGPSPGAMPDRSVSRVGSVKHELSSAALNPREVAESDAEHSVGPAPSMTVPANRGVPTMAEPWYGGPAEPPTEVWMLPLMVVKIMVVWPMGSVPVTVPECQAASARAAPKSRLRVLPLMVTLTRAAVA